MATWIEILKPNTKFIQIDNRNRSITLIHPHWSKVKSTSIYRQLLKSLSCNTYIGYTVVATGFMSVDGLIILYRLQNYLNKLTIVEHTELKHNLKQALYTLEIKFK